MKAPNKINNPSAIAFPPGVWRQLREDYVVPLGDNNSTTVNITKFKPHFLDISLHFTGSDLHLSGYIKSVILGREFLWKPVSKTCDFSKLNWVNKVQLNDSFNDWR